MYKKFKSIISFIVGFADFVIIASEPTNGDPTSIVWLQIIALISLGMILAWNGLLKKERLFYGK